jgi:hypothetical protein
VEDEDAVRKGWRRRGVVALSSIYGEPLGVQPGIEGRGSGVAGMQLSPELAEPQVVLTAALCARSVAGRECRRLIEEEELGVAAGLEERSALPAPELEAAGDPALDSVAATDPALVVVKTAPVAVDEPAARVGDEVPERRHAVLQRA